MIPSLLAYRTKQLALFVLEREPRSKTDRTGAIAAGHESIVCVEFDFRRISVGIDVWVGIVADINAASSPDVKGIDIEAQPAEVTKCEGFLQPQIHHGVATISPSSVRFGSDPNVAVLSINAGGKIDT